ncbi:MAG: glycoside hydrolase family 140 protein [Anaerolineae bacterium]|nr:glycoside hydrolase family 140 protein [Anaerolineae bacterium]
MIHHPEPIRVSPNRRFLVTANGAPFFWLGDTAWELFHRLTREEADEYLENRRRKGMNVIQAVALAEFDGLHTPNPYGHLPLLDDNPDMPNEAYFEHVDAVIDLAAEKGLYIALLPTWGDKYNKMWGGGPVIFNADNAARYGAWMARRYADRSNLIWVLGGDRPESHEGVDFAPVVRAMANGVRSVVGPDAVLTYHPNGGRGSSSTFHNDDWLSMNMWQSGHLEPDLPNWEMIAQDYARTPIKPVLDGEPNYEDHPINPFTRQWRPELGTFNDYDVRKQAYRAVFAGACGHTYGHHSIWQFYTPERTPVNFPQMPWREALDRPGASQLIHLKRLVLSRPYLTRIPDQAMIRLADETRPRRVQATRDSEGRYAFVYVPAAGQTVEVSLDGLEGGMIAAWWYDPRTGEARQIATLERTASVRFISPATGPDWVLVLEDAFRRFPPPGSAPNEG